MKESWFLWYIWCRFSHVEKLYTWDISNSITLSVYVFREGNSGSKAGIRPLWACKFPHLFVTSTARWMTWKHCFPFAPLYICIHHPVTWPMTHEDEWSSLERTAEPDLWGGSAKSYGEQRRWLDNFFGLWATWWPKSECMKMWTAAWLYMHYN